MTHKKTPQVSPSRWRLRTVCGAALLAAAACSQLPPPVPATVAPVVPPTPAAAPPSSAAGAAEASAADPGAGPLLRIDTAASLIAVTVRRGGALARLGHDHVVASHTVAGTVAPARNRADFSFRLDQMTVDEVDLRRSAGLDTQPSADAIAGTRTNMLTRVLDAERYPLVTVSARRGAAGEALKVAITLHGVTRDYAIPVTERQDGASLSVSGTLELNQTDFGLVPFSVMGGAMAVQDKMELRFVIVARPAQP